MLKRDNCIASVSVIRAQPLTLGVELLAGTWVGEVFESVRLETDSRLAADPGLGYADDPERAKIAVEARFNGIVLHFDGYSTGEHVAAHFTRACQLDLTEIGPAYPALTDTELSMIEWRQQEATDARLLEQTRTLLAEARAEVLRYEGHCARLVTCLHEIKRRQHLRVKPVEE